MLSPRHSKDLRTATVNALGDPAEWAERSRADALQHEAEQAAQRVLELQRERDEYRQAALELNFAIDSAVRWIGQGGEPSVATHHMSKAAAAWRALLED